MKTTNIIMVTALTLAACGGEASPDAQTDAVETAEAVGPAGTIDATVVQCTYTDQASIYDVKAAQWRAEYQGSGELRSLNLTVWRPAAGGEDMISLSANKNGDRYTINTVTGSAPVGSGRVTIEEDQDGGARFVIDGEDQNGNPLHATVSCGEFLEPFAEGG